MKKREKRKKKFLKFYYSKAWKTTKKVLGIIFIILGIIGIFLPILQGFLLIAIGYALYNNKTIEETIDFWAGIIRKIKKREKINWKKELKKNLN